MYGVSFAGHTQDVVVKKCDREHFAPRQPVCEAWACPRCSRRLFTRAFPSSAATRPRDGTGCISDMGRLSSSNRQGRWSGPAVFAWRRRMDGWPAGPAEAFRELPTTSAVLDGELCICDAAGRPDFVALHAEMRRHRPDVSRMAFFAFDMLFQNSVDLGICRSPSVSAICAGFAPTGAYPAFTSWKPSPRVDPCLNGVPTTGLRALCRSDEVLATSVDPGINQDQVRKLEPRECRAARPV